MTTYSQSISFLTQSPHRGFRLSHFALRWRQSKQLQVEDIISDHLMIILTVSIDLHRLTLVIINVRGIGLLGLLIIRSGPPTLRGRHSSILHSFFKCVCSLEALGKCKSAK